MIGMAKKQNGKAVAKKNGHSDLTFMGLAARERPGRRAQPRRHPAARRPVERRPEAVANNIKGTLALPHAYGRLQFGEDLDLHFRTLIGTGSNPNVAAVVVIGIEDGWTRAWSTASPRPASR